MNGASLFFSSVFSEIHFDSKMTIEKGFDDNDVDMEKRTHKSNWSQLNRKENKWKKRRNFNFMYLCQFQFFFIIAKTYTNTYTVWQKKVIVAFVFFEIFASDTGHI